MGIFNIFKKSTKPDNDSFADLMYELLFCDNLDLYKNNSERPDSYPWDILFSDTSKSADLEKIIADTNVDPRVKVLAYNKLFINGQNIDKKELLGVIVEVGLDNGLDVLASFRDGTARYINQSGKIIIWETTDDISNDLTDKLFDKSYAIVNQIGPWDKPRRPKPEKGIVRITFLVSNSIYFGEGPINVLFNDAMAGPALSSAAELMKYLIAKSLEDN